MEQVLCGVMYFVFFFFKQKTAYEMSIGDWSSDVCSSDLTPHEALLALRSRRKYDLSPLHRTASLRAMRKARKAGQLTALRIQFEGANLHPAVNGMGRLPARTNYFLGNDPKKWHTDVPSYGRVKYEGVYPGIDVVFYGNQGKLEYDFLVANTTSIPG